MCRFVSSIHLDALNIMYLVDAFIFVNPTHVGYSPLNELRLIHSGIVFALSLCRLVPSSIKCTLLN